jgi:hypothetical protein
MTSPVPGWCTNWQAYNTPRLWAMVADEDNPEAWRQVAAMGAMAETVKDQRSRLQAARAALAEAWPPEVNASAEAFLFKMDDLLLNMETTRQVADENAARLGEVLEALRQAKVHIKPLYDEYIDKSDDWVPSWWDKAEPELDEKARGHMIAAENAIAGPAAKITPPDAYTLQTEDKLISEKRSVPAPSGGDSTSAGRSASGRDSTDAGRVPHDPPPPLPGHEPILPDGDRPTTDTPGPALAGTTPSPAVVPPVTPSPLGPTPGQPGGLGVPGLFSPGGSSIPMRGPLRPFSTSPKATPFGSVIGASPMRGAGSPGKPTPPSWLPMSGRPGRVDSGQRAAGSARPMVGMPGSGQRDRRGRDSGTFDPDDPWFTAEGIDPVIEPSRHEPRHDPGPGVIGWHP